MTVAFAGAGAFFLLLASGLSRSGSDGFPDPPTREEVNHGRDNCTEVRSSRCARGRRAVLVVAVIWTATALAGGGSSGTPDLASGSSGGDPSSVFVQDSDGDGAAPSRDDCPERGGSGGDSSPSDGSSSSGNDL